MGELAEKVKRRVLLTVAGIVGSLGLLFIEMGIAGLIQRDAGGGVGMLCVGGTMLLPAIFLARVDKAHYRLSWLTLPGFALLFFGIVLGMVEWTGRKDYPRHGDMGSICLAAGFVVAGLTLVWPSQQRRLLLRTVACLGSLVLGLWLFYRLYPSFQAYRAGWQAYDHGDYAGALKAFNESLSIGTNSDVTLNARGRTKAALKDYDGAIADYSEAIRLDPKYEYAYYNRGSAKLAKKDYPGAIADASEAMRLSPKNELPSLLRGTAKADSGDYAGAIVDFTESIRISPKRPEPFSGRAYARNAQGDYDGALADCAAALRRNPSYAKAYKNRAAAKNGKGDHAGAIADCDEAIRLSPKLAEAFYIRGTAKQSAGDVPGSKSDFEEAARLGFVAPQKVEK